MDTIHAPGVPGRLRFFFCLAAGGAGGEMSAVITCWRSPSTSSPISGWLDTSGLPWYGSRNSSPSTSSVLLTEEKLCVHWSIAAPHAMDGGMQLRLHPCMRQKPRTHSPAKLENWPHARLPSLWLESRILLPAPTVRNGSRWVISVFVCVCLPNCLWLVTCDLWVTVEKRRKRALVLYLCLLFPIQLFDTSPHSSLPFNVCSCLYLCVSVLTSVCIPHDTFSHAFIMLNFCWRNLRLNIFYKEETYYRLILTCCWKDLQCSFFLLKNIALFGSSTFVVTTLGIGLCQGQCSRFPGRRGIIIHLCLAMRETCGQVEEPSCLPCFLA